MSRPLLHDFAHRDPLAAAPGAADVPVFLGLIDAVLVDQTSVFDCEGAIPRPAARAIWTWMVRDLGPDLIDLAAADATERLDADMPELLTRARAAIGGAEASEEALRRLRGALGGEEHRALLPRVLLALKCRAVIGKAQSFGRAANGIHEEAALAAALQSMPLQDPGIAALLMMAAIGQVSAPARLVGAAIRLAGSGSETAVTRSGFAPLIDAVYAHAQAQLPAIGPSGTFADIDLVCRAIERFHRLHRAVGSLLDLGRGGRWAHIAAGLTKAASDRIEPYLQALCPDINRALRKPREGADRVDADQILTALHGVFVLAMVRDCRDSLALNALFDSVWALSGQAIEIHTSRNLDLVRADPDDEIADARLDAGIKMSELRFGADYADILRKARDAAERRQHAPD